MIATQSNDCRLGAGVSDSRFVGIQFHSM